MCFRYPGIRSQRKSRIIRTSRVELVLKYMHFSSARFSSPISGLSIDFPAILE